MRAHKVLALAVVALFFASCKDEPAEIAGNLFGDNLIDTEIYITSDYDKDLKAKSATMESVDFNGIDYLMLGEYNHSTFGNIKADFLSELSLGSLHDDTCQLHFNSDFEYVSTEFRIRYKLNSWLGDTLAQHKVSVYKLSSALDSEYDYNSNFELPAGIYDEANPLGEKIFELKDGARDTMWKVSGYVHTLAIPLDDELGLKFFEADSQTICSKAGLKELLNGIYVTTEQEDDKAGSLLRIPYTSADAISQEMAVIYRMKKILKDVSDNDSIAYDTIPRVFPINKEATKAIRYSHDYSSSAIDFNDDNSEKIYVQGMGGSQGMVDITTSFINKWKSILPDPENPSDDLITSVASVELSFFVDTVATALDDETDFRTYLPSSLNLKILTDDGAYVTPSFQTAENASSTIIYSGGTRSITSDGDIKYTFTLQTGFFEQFIYPTIEGNKEKSFNHLYIGVPSPEFNFERVVLKGMSISNLSVKYVEIE